MFWRRVAVKESFFPSVAAPVLECQSRISKPCSKRWKNLIRAELPYERSAGEKLEKTFNIQHRTINIQLFRVASLCSGCSVLDVGCWMLSLSLMPDYAFMNQCIYEGKAKEVGEMTQAALDEGRPVQEVLSEGLIAGMSVVGEDFKYNILYVPEVLIAARAMKAGMAILKPLLAAKDSGVEPAGILLMGTVRGDLHDIGKNLVCMMAEGAGFEVYDIGVNQSIKNFLAATKRQKPQIIGMSALLTTTMTYMKTVIDGYKERGMTEIKFAIGGAPISQMY